MRKDYLDLIYKHRRSWGCPCPFCGNVAGNYYFAWVGGETGWAHQCWSCGKRWELVFSRTSPSPVSGLYTNRFLVGVYEVDA